MYIWEITYCLRILPAVIVRRCLPILLFWWLDSLTTRNPAGTHIMIILSAALQITFVSIVVSPSIWLEVHSVVFPTELSLSLSLRTAHSLWASSSYCFWQECPSFSSIYVFSCLYGNEWMLCTGDENDSMSVLLIILCCKALFQVFYIITMKTKIQTNSTIYSQTKLLFS